MPRTDHPTAYLDPEGFREYVGRDEQEISHEREVPAPADRMTSAASFTLAPRAVRM